MGRWGREVGRGGGEGRHHGACLGSTGAKQGDPTQTSPCWVWILEAGWGGGLGLGCAPQKGPKMSSKGAENGSFGMGAGGAAGDKMALKGGMGRKSLGGSAMGSPQKQHPITSVTPKVAPHRTAVPKGQPPQKGQRPQKGQQAPKQWS